ncbi:MAG: hypothetical protein ACK5P7_05395 [Bdellovibrio sp.]|jgi:hypothetical protein
MALSDSKVQSLNVSKSPALTVGLLFLGLALGLGFWASGHRAQLEQKARGRELVAPPLALEHFHFGFRLPMADLLWIRTLQDFDYCEKALGKNLCQGRGWLFQTLDLTTQLDPEFRMAYSAGGAALSVIVSDVPGASQIFDKGTRAFPQDWVLAYKAAYHALYEEQDTLKAANLMKKAAERGAPDWVYILSGRLYTDAGKRELAERVLSEMRALGLDEKVQDRLRQKIQSTVPSSD